MAEQPGRYTSQVFYFPGLCFQHSAPLTPTSFSSPSATLLYLYQQQRQIIFFLLLFAVSFLA